MGRGARAIEHEWFGIDPTESRLRSEEIVTILVTAMTSGNLAYHGRLSLTEHPGCSAPAA